MSEILDSGNRRIFETGATRDIEKGKGRCDLLPLDVVSMLLGKNPTEKTIMGNLSSFVYTHDISHLSMCLYIFSTEYYKDMFDMLLDVSVHYEQGALKYGEHNWEKGIPAHCYLDSAVRHLLKFRRGDEDENHKRAFVWNILSLIWTMTHLPNMNDLAVYTWPEEEKSE